MRKRSPNLSLFGEDEVKPESRSEKKSKQGLPLRSTEVVTMADLWAITSRETKSVVHWANSGTGVACGANSSSKAVLVEHITCEECRSAARLAWAILSSGATRRIDLGEEEE